MPHWSTYKDATFFSEVSSFKTRCQQIEIQEIPLKCKNFFYCKDDQTLEQEREVAKTIFGDVQHSICHILTDFAFGIEVDYMIFRDAIHPKLSCDTVFMRFQYLI